MTHHAIIEDLQDMKAIQGRRDIHINRIIVGYSVNLYRSSKEFAIGCGLFHTKSILEAADWLYENQL